MGADERTGRSWTDSRDGSEWEIKALPVQPQMGDGDGPPMIGEAPYTLRFFRTMARSIVWSWTLMWGLG